MQALDQKSTMTADEAIGAKVNELMFRQRKTRKALGEALGIRGAGVSRKVYGQVGWSINDLYITADFFGVDITDLLPRRVQPAPNTEKEAVSSEATSCLVAGAGFEPTTSGL